MVRIEGEIAFWEWPWLAAGGWGDRDALSRGEKRAASSLGGGAPQNSRRRKKSSPSQLTIMTLGSWASRRTRLRSGLSLAAQYYGSDMMLIEGFFLVVEVRDASPPRPFFPAVD
jgi:hypothetical protein